MADEQPKYVNKDNAQRLYDNIRKQMFVKSAVAPICFMGRLLDRFGYEGGTRVLYSQSAAYDGTYYYSCGSYNSNANQCISKHDATGTIVASANYTELYHAQSLTILGSKIYVAPGNGPYVAIVDLATLAYESTITLTESTIANVFSLSAYEGELYARCRDNAYNEYIYKINTSTGACTLVCSMGSFLNRVNQGFCYAGEVAYCVNNFRSAIFEIDTKTGDIIRTYNLPSGDGQYPIGEPEDMFMVGGSLVLMCAEYFNNAEQQKAAISYLFKTGIGETVQNDITEGQAVNAVLLTVNGNAVTEFAPYKTFNTLEEACLIANYVHGATITVSNLTTGYAALYDGKYAINGSGGTQPLSMLTARNTTVNLRAVKLDAASIDNSGLYAYACTVGSITALFCHLLFSDLTILAGSTLDYRYCDIRYENLITCASDVVGYSDSASRAYNRVIIDTNGSSTYLPRLLQSSTRRAGFLAIYNGGMSSGAIQTASFTASTFTFNVTGDTKYQKINYKNGGFYLVDSSDAEVEIAAGTVLRITV